MIGYPASTGRNGELARESRPSPLRSHLIVLAILLGAVAVLFAGTFRSMLMTWLQSNTFLHGTLILPISAWLIWLKRCELAAARTSAYWPAAFGLLLLSLSWWFADALGVQVVQHLAVTVMVVTAVVAVMGPAFSRVIAFPLAYLIFAVPIGEALVPYLIDYTAAFTVKALNVTGIPVFRDGRYFSIPAGNFEVARACSGIRYLLAALALGTLFSYVMFKDIRKRLIFIVFSIVMPIIANGLRAYAIVMMAQFVSIEFATGVDHIIFGWIFFGIVVSLMFYVGSLFADHAESAPADGAEIRPAAAGSGGAMPVTVTLLVVSIACVAAGPALALYTAGQSVARPAFLSGMPGNVPGWQGEEVTEPGWRPRFLGATHEEQRRFRRGDAAVDIAILRYRQHDQAGELANSENVVADPEAWRFGNTQLIHVSVAEGGEVTVSEVIAHNRRRIRTIWYWYDVDGRRANSDLGVKLLEARSVLAGNVPLSSAVIMSVDATHDIDGSREVLRDFVEASIEPLTICLGGRGGNRFCGVSARVRGVR